ncbi:MAG: DUF2141 domain-containing protein [Pseudomonadota bacterium]
MRTRPSTFAAFATHIRRDALAFALLAGVGAIATPCAQAEDAAEATPLSIEVVNVTEPSGQLYVQVLPDEESFKNGGPAAAQLVVPVSSAPLRFELPPLPAGDYAVRLMQDLDGDGQLKTNMVGMPKEPWGVSNDAKGRFGPPSWKDARFEHPAAGALTITLQ